MRYKMVGGQVLIKKDVVPHIFKCRPSTSMDFTDDIEETIEEPVCKKRRTSNIDKYLPSTSGSTTRHRTVGIQVKCQSFPIGVQTHFEQRDFSTSVSPDTKNCAVMCNILPERCHVQLDTTDLSTRCDIATSPLKRPPQFPKQLFFSTKDTSASATSEDGNKASTSDFIPSSDHVSENKSKDLIKELEQQATCEYTVKLIERNPKRYVGIPKQWFNIVINKLCVKATLNRTDILLCLMKIKVNDSFMRLGDQFGISCSRASIIFKKNIPKIEFYLKTLVFWPKPEVIKMLLPIPFRIRYSEVQSIIDCLEIEIQKPTNSLKQALTWSEYKKCNTVKYLISCTPDGFINFVSTGYGGRTSDMTILEQCDFLKILPTNCHVMADRGFKHVDKMLAQKQCTLIRPPSVASTTKPTKQEVIESKRIASLRIHIERVIKRLREFAFLKPHSVIDHSLIVHTDSMINISCALINLQSPIIK